MKNPSQLFVVPFFFLFQSALFAQEEVSKPPLEKVRYEISLEDGTLGGPGAEWIKSRVSENHFVVFGEQHATKEIAEAGIAIFKMARAEGFEIAAVEVGRFGIEIVEALLREGGMKGYREYMARDINLMTVPFFFFAEESPLLDLAVAGTNKAPALWGLDQEFIASSPSLLKLLLAEAETPEQQAAVEGLMAQADQVPFLVGAFPAEAFAGLREVFGETENERAKAIIEEIIITNRIYAPFLGRGGSVYLANDERENLMKTNFQRYLGHHREKYQEIPKVFFKFGASHASRGRSQTDVYALGNHVMEFAAQKGLTMFNIHADCFGGEQLNVQTGQEIPCKSYFTREGDIFNTFAFEEGLTLFDLKSLRRESQFLKTLENHEKDLIFAYDALLVIRGTTPASLLPGTLPDLTQ